MTQDKLRRIITACVSAATVLLVFLTCFLIYQGITKAVLDKRIDRLEKANAEIEKKNEELLGEAEHWESDLGKEWLAFQNGFIKENQ